MIGDSAKRARAKQNAAKHASFQVPHGSHAASEKEIETSKAFQFLIDTNEQTDSQPFERPGFGLPWGGQVPWQRLGLHWQRSATVVKGSDQTSLVWRALLAVVVSSCYVALFILLTSFCIRVPLRGIGLALTFLVPISGAVICWAFLQTLPRSDQYPWSILSRLIATGIIIIVVCWGSAILSRFTVLRVDDIFIPILFIFGLTIDFRCFIAADRYPRVGLPKTFWAVGMLFVVSLLFFEDGPPAIMTAILGAAVIISIQILAPHVQVPKKKHAAENSKVGQVIDLDDQIDELAETRGEPDSILLKEKI